MTATASWQSLAQLLRYGTLGLLTNVAGYTLYLGITYLGMGPKPAMTILYCVGTCISFVGNKRWVFASDARMLSATLRYVAAYAVGYVINFSVLSVFVDRLNFPHAYVQAASVAIVAIFLFASFKLFVFPRSDAISGNAG
ncbi:GtrA family protein [Rhizobium sp. YTU87027]|uniref:GtrA family protein n=1 Tax=Rhizobium sp. YTU87027 TaxID=3417741 RepID=UPI003D688573